MKGKVNLKLADASQRMAATQKIHPKKWGRMGENLIESINQGQAPRILAVGPRVVGGLKARYLNKPGYGGVPGSVFEVTTHNDGYLDAVGEGSVYYAIKHLGITVVDVWANGSRTESQTIRSLKKIIGMPVEIRENSIFGDESSNIREAEAVVVSCSDSRVQVHDIYDDVVVVSNAGNILSPVALEVIDEAVALGVPIAMILGHTKCGAVGAAVAGNTERPLQEIMNAISRNLGGEQSGAEIKNAVVSAEFLKDRFSGKNMSTEVAATFLDLSDGTVGNLI